MLGKIVLAVTILPISVSLALRISVDIAPVKVRLCMWSEKTTKAILFELSSGQ